MRLDKFLANNTQHSRSEVKKLAKFNRIKVNQSVVKDCSLGINTKIDIVEVDDQKVFEFEPLYLMLNKPPRYICANTDPHHPTVLDLIVKENLISKISDDKLISNINCICEGAIQSKLQIAGRLDNDTTGLVLLTSDGDWNHRVTSPNTHCKKRYLVSLAHAIQKNDIEMLEAGIQLKNEPKPTRPADIEVISSKLIKLYITEGKYHQVKRMLAATGNHVEHLHREAIGPIELDSSLLQGQYRFLTPDEKNSFI